MIRRMSFRAPEPPRTPGHHPIVPLMMIGMVVLSWAGAVGLVWVGYVVCVAAGWAS
jgi:hypothetical protein